MAREANWRCCAMVSATSFRAATFSSASVMICVVRGGIASSGFGGGTTSSSVAEDIVARGEVWKSGGRKCEEEGVGWSRGVEVWELSVDGGRRTRLARRKVKNAVDRNCQLCFVYVKCVDVACAVDKYLEGKERWYRQKG